jgi:DNA-binding SARP family transcriptional activator/DNA-binding CsgD family transcriptional regulator/tetratricopeptide (TPR) repeat protein
MGPRTGTASVAHVRLGVLGPLVATLNGSEVSLGGPRQRAVLAVLAVAHGRHVTTEQLLDALWQGVPPASGAATLQSYVSHLRRALEPHREVRAPSRVLVGSGNAYALAADAVDVDAWRFERLVADAARQPDAADRASMLQQALEEWRGPALAEYAGQDWADQEAQRLEGLRGVAHERLLGARLDRGESELVVPEIEALLRQDRLREERWRLLALAQYRSHRQADALATLRNARATLSEELGVDPGPALRSLEAEVLAQSPSLDAPRAPAATTTSRGTARPVRASTALVDRQGELDRLHGCLERALAGEASVAVVAGPAGIGKTSLMHELREEAVAAGMTVLSARASQLEREFGFGVVRQLFEPLLADRDTRESVLTGAAATAGRVFDTAPALDQGSAESLFGVLHGLYWLTSNLAAAGPVMVAVDDVQWSDTASLRFLGYLTHRVESLPVLVVATLRTGEPSSDDDLVHEILAHPEVVTVRPRPLSPDGTEAVVRERLDDADSAFVTACFRTTSGNPLLLRQLLRALEAEGVRPDASHADTVRAIGSRAVSSMVMMRFRRMPAGHRDVARAIAVLGHGATLPLVAELSGLGESETASAVAGLARSEVLRAEQPLAFVHPLVESAVYDDLSLGERELQHARAVRVLDAGGASPEQVAAHLLQVSPRGDPRVVDVLRAAAARDVERGSTESATSYLRRALLEPPSDDDRPLLLMELGRLEALADGMNALAHLEEAYRLLEDPVAKTECAIMLARTAVFAGARGEATRLARAAAEQTPREQSDQRQGLVALSRVAGFMHGLPVEDYLTGPLPAIVGEQAGARGLAALEAWELVCAGEERERAIELARFAVADRVLQRSDPGLLWVVAGNALFLSGVDTVPFWEAELDAAHRSGSMFASLACHLWLGHVLWQRGELDAAEQSLSAGTEQNLAWSLRGIGQMYVQPFTAHIHLDRGDVAAAREVVERSRATLRMGDSVRLFLEVEALVLHAEGRDEEALSVLDEAQQLMQVVLNPVWRAWRSQRAVVLDSLGRTEEALALVVEELELAERWGTPGLVGRTWRTRGVLEREAGEASLRAAIDHLARSPLRLELARAQAALAGLTGEAEARSLLTSASDVAGECGAVGLWREVAQRLRDLGVDVPDGPPPRERLTTTERRIAAMTAEGRHPNEIAQAFFLTLGTVRSVASSVMTRLGVETVEELRAALERA